LRPFGIAIGTNRNGAGGIGLDARKKAASPR
jgi:hypothetical protein